MFWTVPMALPRDYIRTLVILMCAASCTTDPLLTGPCVDLPEGAILPHDDDCRGWSLCSNGTAIVMPACGTGLVFSRSESTCVREGELFDDCTQTDESGSCGQNFTSPAGVFLYPTSGRFYLKDQDCTWCITAMPGNRILVQFTAFQLRYSRYCSDDMVKIYDGLDTQSPPVRTHCGQHLPPPYLSIGHVLNISFHSDQFGTDTGFRLVWKVADTFVRIDQLLTWNDADRWCQNGGSHLATLTSETELSISEILPDKAALWTGRYYTPLVWLKGCYRLPWDSTEFVYQRSTQFKTNQQKVCAIRCRDSNYFALQNSTCFCFDDLHEGFKFVPTGSWCTVTCPGNADERCGSQYSVTVYMNDLCWTNASEWIGTISRTISGRTCQRWTDDTPHTHAYHADGNFPDGSVDAASNYCRNPDGASKPWCYTTDPHKPTDFCDVPRCFNTTLSHNERYPCVVVKTNKRSGRMHVYQRSCDGRHSYFSNYKDAVYINYRPSYTWQASREQCRGHSDYTAFTLGNVWVLFVSWPGDTYRWIGYSRNTTDVMETAFASDLTPSDCLRMWKTYKGISEVAVSCDEKCPFVCQYSSVCGGATTDERSGNITSPGYPGDYGANLYCQWSIHVDNDSFIMLEFTDINMEDSIKCYSDFIQIYDDNISEMNNTLGTLCGRHNRTIKIVSSGNAIKLEFKSDNTVFGRGFSATWVSVPMPTTIDTSTVAMRDTNTTAADAMNSVKPNINTNNTSSNTADGVYALSAGLALLAVAAVAMCIICRKRRNRRRQMKQLENPVYYMPNSGAHDDSVIGGAMSVYDNIDICKPTTSSGSSKRDICLTTIQTPDKTIECRHDSSSADELDDNIYDTTSVGNSEPCGQAHSTDTENGQVHNYANKSYTYNTQNKFNVEDCSKHEQSQNMEDEYDHTLSYQQTRCFQKGIAMTRQSASIDSTYSHRSQISRDTDNDHIYANAGRLSDDELNPQSVDTVSMHRHPYTPDFTESDYDHTSHTPDSKLCRQLDISSRIYDHTSQDVETDYDHTLSYNQSRGVAVTGQMNKMGRTQATHAEYDQTLISLATDIALDKPADEYPHIERGIDTDYDHTLPYQQTRDLSSNAGPDESDCIYMYHTPLRTNMITH